MIITRRADLEKCARKMLRHAVSRRGENEIVHKLLTQSGTPLTQQEWVAAGAGRFVEFTGADYNDSILMTEFEARMEALVTWKCVEKI